MERMIKRIAVKKDGTISMSEFRNFAEKSQGEINDLEKENKKLNIKVASLEGEIKGLNYTIDRLHKEIEELEKSHLRFSDFGGYDLDNNK